MERLKKDHSGWSSSGKWLKYQQPQIEERPFGRTRKKTPADGVVANRVESTSCIAISISILMAVTRRGLFVADVLSAARDSIKRAIVVSHSRYPSLATMKPAP